MRDFHFQKRQTKEYGFLDNRSDAFSDFGRQLNITTTV